AGKNTATVSWGAQTLASGAELAASSASFDKTFDFASASPTLVNNSINVDDSNGGSWAFSNSGSVSYIDTFNDPEGTCTEHTNTATIRELPTKTDSVTVSDCQGSDLIVTKTAEASFDRSYQWEIEKDVDETYIELRPGDTDATFNYTVEVSHNEGTDGNWKVTGVITVENPNDWQDVTIDSLTDSIDNGGDCSIDFAATMTVEKSDSNEYPYECTYEGVPDSDAFTNTATASWDAEAYNTPNGSDDGTAEGAFDEPTTKIDECIDVSDDLYGGALGTVCVGDVDLTFNYSNDVPAPELGDCVTVNNTASFVTTDDANDTAHAGSSSESVDVCTYNAPSTIGYWKTHMHVCVAREKQATAGCSNNGPFTGQYLPQTLGNFNVNTEAKALAIFNGNKCSSLSTGSNALACLAAQLLATKLNIANSSNPSCISATVTAADAFLISKSYAGPTGSYTLTAAQRATAITLKTALDNYNNNGC
ncbi:MAG TPA: hypothetical protein VEX62_08410, partial [Candidatus Limnocylindrales bacterium]|nr:hypothetical protein [Candidatus Limnocylindrales bacterium]